MARARRGLRCRQGLVSPLARLVGLNHGIRRNASSSSASSEARLSAKGKTEHNDTQAYVLDKVNARSATGQQEAREEFSGELDRAKQSAAREPCSSTPPSGAAVVRAGAAVRPRRPAALGSTNLSRSTQSRLRARRIARARERGKATGVAEALSRGGPGAPPPARRRLGAALPHSQRRSSCSGSASPASPSHHSEAEP